MILRPQNSDHEEIGFTLVELLVVIIILGILAAIAIPAFMNQRKRATDATLMSDTKNVAQELTAWFGEGQQDADDIFDITGKTSTAATSIALGIYGKGRIPADITTTWNHYSALPKINVSPNNQVTVTLNRTSGGYFIRHASGDFCLSANNDNSSFHYSTPGATGTGNYHKLLYYDVQLGGITNMTEMVAAVQAQKPTSCGHFAKNYMAAKGIPIP